jgi:sulfonate transport system substrate-binding protein
VREDSPIKTLADLKGKKIGFAKAAGAHYLLIAALDKAGLSFKDIEPAYLTPADGRAAFEKGAIDAWVVWDPFLAAAQRQAKVACWPTALRRTKRTKFGARRCVLRELATAS